MTEKAKPGSCPFCGAGRSPRRYKYAAWRCGTFEVGTDDDGVALAAPMYDTGTECDKTVFSRGFLRCLSLLERVNAHTVSVTPLSADVIQAIQDEINDPDRMREKLLSCPFCGRCATRDNDPSRRPYAFRTRCPHVDCAGFHNSWDSSQESADAKWQARPK